jgi:hypothetical protein
MLTLTIALWFLSVCLAASFGFAAGFIMVGGVRSDMGVSAPQRRNTIIGSCGRNSEPHLVLISPTEFRAVKTGAQP